MRVVIQRVSHASVTIEGVCKSAIKEGFMILVGIEEADTQEDADWLCKKIIGLRVFDDENGVMNKSILEVPRCLGSTFREFLCRCLIWTV